MIFLKAKRFLTFIAVILAALLVMASCSSSYYKGYSSYDNYEYSPEGPEIAEYSGSSVNLSYSANYADDFDGSEAKINTKSKEARKIIYSSSFTIQTTEFDKTISLLDGLCEKYGAYYETSETYGAEGSSDRSGYYTIRVPVENYKAFRNETGDIGTVTRSSENNEDITERYFDSEARLDSAKLREERLLDILSKADSLDDVLLLESELADVRYEIESLSGTLRKYDSLISYSTIDVYVYEVYKTEQIQSTPKSFGERISQSTLRGFSDFADGFQDFLIYLSYALPSLILLAVIVIITVVVVKLILKKSKKKKAANANNASPAAPAVQDTAASDSENKQ